MSAYFILKTTAAAWHSAVLVLVLVDEGKAEEARQRQIIQSNEKGSSRGKRLAWWHMGGY